MYRFAAIAGLGLGLALSPSVRATEVETFDNFSLGAEYGSWGSTTLTTFNSGPTAFTVTSTHYGSGYSYLGSTIDATGADTLVANVDVTEGVAGVIFDLSDDNGNGQSYPFYGLVPGGGTNGTNNYTLTMPLASGNYFSGSGVLDPSILTNLNIEIDPGPSTAQYSVTYNDLSVVNSAAATPEPTSLALGALGCTLVARRRRR